MNSSASASVIRFGNSCRPGARRIPAGTEGLGYRYHAVRHSPTKAQALTADQPAATSSPVKVRAMFLQVLASTTPAGPGPALPFADRSLPRSWPSRPRARSLSQNVHRSFGPCQVGFEDLVFLQHPFELSFIARIQSLVLLLRILFKGQFSLLPGIGPVSYSLGLDADCPCQGAFEPSSRHFSCSSRIAFLSLTVKCRFDCRTGITKSMMDLPRPVRRAQIKQENLSHKSLTHREETLRYSAIAVSVAGTAFAERCNPSTSSYNSARESQDSALPRASSALNRQQKWTLTFAFGIAVQGVRG